MILFLTVNDSYSGIYSGQVIDVIKYLNSICGSKVRLLALVPLRTFFKNRKNIKQELPSAWVIPMFPRLKKWKRNQLWIRFFCKVTKPDTIWARGVFAAQLALDAKNRGKRIAKVIYDGRGAIAEEWKEYKFSQNVFLLENIERWEKEAVIHSDFQIAVSGKLLEFWKTKFGYKSKEHVVIPCLLNTQFATLHLTEKRIADKRKELGFLPGDILCVYSGSLAAWQSIEKVNDALRKMMKENSHVKALFLSDPHVQIRDLREQFGDNRVKQMKVPVQEMPEYLFASDYGILIREETMTNNVSSPVKFAEYLASGLKVIITDTIGDYSEFVVQHEAGLILKPDRILSLSPVSFEEKERLSRLAIAFFSKKKFKCQYEKVLSI